MIFLISYYFPPEISAGSYRSYDLAKSIIKNIVDAEKKLIVITAKERRYNQNIDYSLKNEFVENFKLIRIYVPFKGGGSLKGVLNFICFSILAIIKTIRIKPSYVISTSGRLATSCLAFILSKINNSKLILDVRDIFPLNLKRLIFKKNKRIGNFFFLFFISLERFIYHRANKINVVSPYFIKFYKRMKFDTSRWTSYTNGIDKEFIYGQQNEFKFNYLNNKKIVLYAGNLGDGQKIDVFINEFSEQLPVGWKFVIIGNGSRKNKIINIINQKNLKNIIIKDAVSRKKIKYYYKSASVLLVSLGSERCLSYVIPSKIFEYGTFNKPVLAGANGFTSKFIKKELPLAEIFLPGNGSDAALKLKKLINKKHSKAQIIRLNIKKSEFIKKFSREEISKKFINNIFYTEKS